MALKPETLESIKLYDWIRMHKKLRHCAFHIPNEGKRSVIMGGILKRMGMRAGVADYFIAYPVGVKHGLWVELKAKNATGVYNTASTHQRIFLQDMLNNGYSAYVCNGADEAIRVIEDYLAGRA